MIATHLLWTAAGYPTIPNAIETQGVCWWCASGLDAVPLTGTALGIPLATMPDTFLDACGRDAGSPSSTHLCPACAWTLSDAVRLPVYVGTPLLHRALHGDQEHPGRVSVAVGDEAPVSRLVTPVDAVGHVYKVGVWERPGKAPDETRWVAARADLRARPVDVGPARYLGAYSAHDLARAVGGKFRNFIPFATASGRWEMWTKADRAKVRAVLLNPPRERWTLAIGDGQKHAAICAKVSDGRERGQVVRFEDTTVYYAPDALRRVVEAVDQLLELGIRREAVESGRYPFVGDGLRASALKANEARIRPFRGGPLLPLALWMAVKTEQTEEVSDGLAY